MTKKKVTKRSSMHVKSKRQMQDVSLVIESRIGGDLTGLLDIKGSFREGNLARSLGDFSKSMNGIAGLRRDGVAG